MSGLPRISGRECIKALTRAGFAVKRQRGSHVVLRRDHPFSQVVVPEHPELDRGTTGPLSSVLSTLVAGNKRYSLHIYENTNHAFHNDTGPAYDPAAACEAWARTIAWFDKFLKQLKAA